MNLKQFTYKDLLEQANSFAEKHLSNLWKLSKKSLKIG